MTTDATLTLPMPISTNKLFAGKSRRYRSPAYKAWIAEADLAYLQQRRQAHMFAGPVRVSIEVSKPDNRTRDLDNMLKCVLDHCTGKLWEDDSQVHDLRIRWADDVNGCLITVEPLA